jgi:gamma-glutamyltranspeptidase / glutathione hydrolase
MLALKGAKEGFYKNEIGAAIVKAISEYGGVLSMEDLEAHETAREDPISILYKGHRSLH